MCKRQAANPTLPEAFRDAAGGGPPVLRKKELAAPLRRRKPARIGVQFMGDLFHEDVPDTFLDKIWITMGLAHRQVFLVLTKRPRRMRHYTESIVSGKRKLCSTTAEMYGTVRGLMMARILQGSDPGGKPPYKPLPNLWLGVSVEDQDQAWRIDELLKCPAARYFVSHEPALGPLELGLDACACDGGPPEGCDFFHQDASTCPHNRKLDWVICGGETGPGARPMNPAWPRKLRDDCQDADVPFFFKHWGEWADVPRVELHGNPKAGFVCSDCGENGPLTEMAIAKHRATGCQGSTLPVWRIGKKAAGRLLDGVEHNELPKGGSP